MHFVKMQTEEAGFQVFGGQLQAGIQMKLTLPVLKCSIPHRQHMSCLRCPETKLLQSKPQGWLPSEPPYLDVLEKHRYSDFHYVTGVAALLSKHIH